MFLYFRKKRSVVAIAEAFGSDAYWANVSTLLRMEGANNGTSFTDEKGNVVTSNGATTSTSTKLFGTSSAYFAAGGGLQLPSTTSISGTGDFTIEFWINPTAFVSGYQLLCAIAVSSGLTIRLNSTGTIAFAPYTLAVQGTTSNTVTFGTWNHIAIVRKSGVGYVFINGVQGWTGAVTTNYALGIVRIGVDGNGSSYPYTGYMDEFRITKFVARYLTAFTVPTTAFSASSYQNFEADWHKTELLISGNSVADGQNNTFVDSSANNFAVTRSGNATQGTYSPFSIPTGYWSTYFDGTGDYILAPANAANVFGTGAFTVECWIFPTAFIGVATFIGQMGGGTTALSLYLNSTGKLVASTNTAGYGTTTMSVPLHAWSHIAACYSGSGSLRVYINGALAGSWGQPYNLSSNVLCVGGNSSNTLTGNVSNARVVVGTSIYNAAFTPPSGPLLAVAGTVLLTCQDSRFKDKSINNYALSVYGNTKVATATPFNNPAEISEIGSGYFDGVGDSLSVPSNAAFDMSTGDFTVECWFNYTGTTNTNPLIIGNNPGSWSAGAISLCVDAGNTNKISLSVNSHSSGVAALTSISTIAYGTWHHVAVTRVGTALKLFVNGVLEVTATISASLGFNFGQGSLRVGGGNWDGANSSFAGYLCNLRVSKGIAKYSASFLPALVQADETTSLLMNFNNAQITDRTGRNVIETIGATKVSTTTFATGSGAIYFNGTTDMLKIIGAPDQFCFGARDFTIELWVYPMASSQGAILQLRPNSATNGPIALYKNTSNAVIAFLSSASGGWDLMNPSTLTPALPLNRWSHVAICKSGTLMTTYLDGVFGSAFTLGSANVGINTSSLFIGADGNGTNFFQGYMDDIRITRGLSRYSSQFSPRLNVFPEKYFVNDEHDPYWNNVVFSTNFENGFIDAKGHAITTQGVPAVDTEIRRFGSKSYKNALGAGYLRSSTGVDLKLPGTFTVEYFVKFNSSHSYGSMVCVGSYGDGFIIRNQTVPAGSFVINGTTVGYGQPSLYDGAWHHICVTRDSVNTVRYFIDGVVIASATITGVVNSTGSYVTIGASQHNTTETMDGWIDEIRITNGVARYIAPFSIPTTAFPQR